MQKLSPFELTQNPFELIGHQWAMITTRAGDVTNTMTASWGGLGVLWGKPVATIFLRPQRYTRELMDKSERFSLCFFPERWRKQLSHCGAVSGRHENKLASSGFTELTLDDAPAIAQAELILTCKKLYRQSIVPDSFFDKALAEEHYPNQDYHIMYVAEVIGAYIAD